MTLGKLHTADIIDQSSIANLLTESTKGRRDLGIKQGRGQHTEFTVYDLLVLSRGMNNLQRSRWAQNPGQWCGIDVREWIDTNGPIRCRKLQQAEFWIVRADTFELSIYTDPGGIQRILANSLKPIGCPDHVTHGRARQTDRRQSRLNLPACKDTPEGQNSDHAKALSGRQTFPTSQDDIIKDYQLRSCALPITQAGNALLPSLVH